MGKRVANIPTSSTSMPGSGCMDEFDEYTQLISLGSPPIEIFFGPDDAVRMARIGNDGRPKLCRSIPIASSVYSSLPSQPKREGIQSIGNSARSQRHSAVYECPRQAPRLPEFHPVFEEAARLDVPIWIHPRELRIFPITPPRKNPNTKSGGPSAGLMRPARPWPAWCSRACSTACRSQDHHSSHGRHDSLL